MCVIASQITGNVFFKHVFKLAAKKIPILKHFHVTAPSCNALVLVNIALCMHIPWDMDMVFYYCAFCCEYVSMDGEFKWHICPQSYCYCTGIGCTRVIPIASEVNLKAAWKTESNPPQKRQGANCMHKSLSTLHIRLFIYSAVCICNTW